MYKRHSMTVLLCTFYPHAPMHLNSMNSLAWHGQPNLQIAESSSELDCHAHVMHTRVRVNMSLQSLVMDPCQQPQHQYSISVRSKCTALLNQKHGRFGRVRALASAHALHLTTYYHMPEYFGQRTGSLEVNPEWSVASEEIECRVQMEARVILEVRNQSLETQSGSSRQ